MNTIIVQGGGFMTSFTTGVLDAFQMSSYRPFESHIGISGGSIALSYFLSNQYGDCYQTMLKLVKDRRFMRYSKVLTDGLLNLDFFHEIARIEQPFHFNEAMKTLESKKYYVVLTKNKNGEPVYFTPNKKNWVDAVIASSTIPFSFTRAKTASSLSSVSLETPPISMSASSMVSLVQGGARLMGVP